MCWVRSVFAEWPTYDYLNTNHMGIQYLFVTLVAACGYPPWIFFRVNLVGSSAKQPPWRLFFMHVRGILFGVQMPKPQKGQYGHKPSAQERCNGEPQGYHAKRPVGIAGTEQEAAECFTLEQDCFLLLESGV